MMLRLSGSLLKRPSLTSAGKSSRRSSCVLMAYGRCLRPALYSSLRSSPSHPMGVSALRVTIAIAHAANNGGFASQLPSRAGFFAMNPAPRMRPTELRYWRMEPDPDPRSRNTRCLACDHAQPANQHRQQRVRCSLERNKMQQNARLRKVATTPVHLRNYCHQTPLGRRERPTRGSAPKQQTYRILAERARMARNRAL